jgi:hypothetical protein
MRGFLRAYHFVNRPLTTLSHQGYAYAKACARPHDHGLVILAIVQHQDQG